MGLVQILGFTITGPIADLIAGWVFASSLYGTLIFVYKIVKRLGKPVK